MNKKAQFSLGFFIACASIAKPYSMAEQKLKNSVVSTWWSKFSMQNNTRVFMAIHLQPLIESDG